MRVLRRLPIVLLAAAVIAFSPAAVASASNFGSEGTAGGSIYNNGVWLTSNSTLSVTRLELSATYSNAVQSILMGQYDPTDLSVIVATTDACYWYDVCYMDYYYGDGLLQAWTYCAGTTSGSHPNQVCSQIYVIIDNVWNPPANHTICHETGHSVGLRHSDDTSSCLHKEPYSSVLTNHDRAHINAAY